MQALKLKQQPTLLLLILFSLFCTVGYSQQKITLKAENESLKNVLDLIQKQSEVSYIYSPLLFRNTHPVTIDLKEVTIEAALDAVFSNQPLLYALKNNMLIIQEKPNNHRHILDMKKELRK